MDSTAWVLCYCKPASQNPIMALKCPELSEIGVNTVACYRDIDTGSALGVNENAAKEGSHSYVTTHFVWVGMVKASKWIGA